MDKFGPEWTQVRQLVRAALEDKPVGERPVTRQQLIIPAAYRPVYISFDSDHALAGIQRPGDGAIGLSPGFNSQANLMLTLALLVKDLLPPAWPLIWISAKGLVEHTEPDSESLLRELRYPDVDVSQGEPEIVCDAARYRPAVLDNGPEKARGFALLRLSDKMWVIFPTLGQLRMAAISLTAGLIKEDMFPWTPSIQ